MPAGGDASGPESVWHLESSGGGQVGVAVADFVANRQVQRQAVQHQRFQELSARRVFDPKPPGMKSAKGLFSNAYLSLHGLSNIEPCR